MFTHLHDAWLGFLDRYPWALPVVIVVILGATVLYDALKRRKAR